MTTRHHQYVTIKKTAPGTWTWLIKSSNGLPIAQSCRHFPDRMTAFRSVRVILDETRVYSWQVTLPRNAASGFRRFIACPLDAFGVLKGIH